jgi:hypothetical protein
MQRTCVHLAIASLAETSLQANVDTLTACYIQWVCVRPATLPITIKEGQSLKKD